MELALASYPYLLHPCPTVLVSCADGGRTNLIAIAWIMPVSVDPPLLALSVRPQRYSHDLIVRSGEFGVNVMGQEHAAQVLFCGRRSGRDRDKWAASGLTPQPARVIGAPLVAEAAAHLECRLVEQWPAGDHTLFLGQVVAAAVVEELWTGQTYDLERFAPLLHIGKNRFATTRPETVEPPLGQ
jgi:flavin reductase (DIM6/NTAB) family NADH-FMN oxidoreductase RutF